MSDSTTTADVSTGPRSSAPDEIARRHVARAGELIGDIRARRLSPRQQVDATDEYFWHQTQVARLRAVTGRIRP